MNDLWIRTVLLSLLLMSGCSDSVHTGTTIETSTLQAEVLESQEQFSEKTKGLPKAFFPELKFNVQSKLRLNKQLATIEALECNWDHHIETCTWTLNGNSVKEVVRHFDENNQPLAPEAFFDGVENGIPRIQKLKYEESSMDFEYTMNRTIQYNLNTKANSRVESGWAVYQTKDGWELNVTDLEWSYSGTLGNWNLDSVYMGLSWEEGNYFADLFAAKQDFLNLEDTDAVAASPVETSEEGTVGTLEWKKSGGLDWIINN